MAELIKRDDAFESIAPGNKQRRVAHKGLRVARDGGDQRDGRLGERTRLRLGASARWIEEHGVEPRELFFAEWPAKEVALLARQRPHAGNGAGRYDQTCKRWPVAIDGVDVCALGEV
jgi:hypothetical protein